MGPVLLDHDRKKMSVAASETDQLGGFLGAVQHVAPAMNGARRHYPQEHDFRSAQRQDGSDVLRQRGLHVYLMIKDRSDALRAVAVMHDRLTLAGCGWAYVLQGGQILMRSPVDAIATKTPERTVFEGLRPSRLRSPRTATPARPGSSTARRWTRAALPNLSPEERRKVDAIRAGWRKGA